MAEIYDFKLSKEELVALSDKVLSEGNAERCIDYLKQALALDETYSDASIKLASVYAGLGAFQISNTVLYKALVSVKNGSEQESQIFLQLANNFMDMGDTEVAAYYMRYFGDEFSFEENGGGDDCDFTVTTAKSRNEDYYQMLIDKAYTAVRERRFDDALELVSRVDNNSKCAEAKNHIVLVCYMMKDDMDRVIDEAQNMLKKTPDNLAVLTTLATAYMMEEKLPEAYLIAEDIVRRNYKNIEEILMILPLAVSLKMHVEVVKYTKIVLENMPLQPNTLIWLSQGLYNIGQKAEANRVMNRVKTVYGEYSPADYYLALYKTAPDEIEYNMNLPYDERLRRFKKLDEYAKMPKADFDKQLVDGTELADLVKWAFYDGNEKIEKMTVNRLNFTSSDWVRNFYKDVLILPDLNFDVMSMILLYLFGNSYSLDFNIVTQDRFKDVSICLPDAFYSLPLMMKRAVWGAICDIVFTDEDPTTYLDRLTTEVNQIVKPANNDRLVWKNKRAEKISRARSAETLTGVLLAKVYFDEENPKEDNIARYGLNKRTFDRYFSIVFGDEEGDDDYER